VKGEGGHESIWCKKKKEKKSERSILIIKRRHFRESKTLLRRNFM